MRRLVLITVIIDSAAWLQLLLLVVHLTGENVSALPQTPSTDPCDSAPCGKGAECKSMGSIAICVCPNNDKGDPFIECMKSADEAELAKPSDSSPAASSVHHQSRASPGSTTAKTTPSPPPSTTSTTKRVSLITAKPTSGPTTTTTTRSPYVHVFQTTTQRPPSYSSDHDIFPHDHDNRHGSHSHSHGDNSIPPESHRIPIISNSNERNTYPNHEYPPRPINGDRMSTPSPNYSNYNNGGSGSSTTYDIFNEKTAGPIAGPDYGFTSSYPYRGSSSSSSGHYSGSQSAYEYDSRPILGSHHRPMRPTPTSGYHHDHANRFGQHNYHPASSGFPDPITEPSSSRYNHNHASLASSSSRPIDGNTYDIYSYNQMQNDIPGSSSRIADPLGKYENCRMVNGIVVCADNTNPFPYNHHQYLHHDSPAPLHHHSGSHHHRGDVMTSTTNYGFHSSRDRDQYSSYYPSRYTSSSPMMTSDRPLFDYNYVNRHDYPQHGPRRPIDMETSPLYDRHHSFIPKEQKISSQSVLTISSTTSRNDNGNPLCRSMCGINSVCRLVLDRPVCGCPEGHTGDPSVRCDPVQNSGNHQRRDIASCEKHVECKETEICAKNRCIDPCKNQDQISAIGSSSVRIDTQFKTSICGTNAECLVVGHTPLCKCTQGYFGNPYVSCSP